MSALNAARVRQSWSKVTDDAPTHEELLDLIAAAGRVADHSALKPWRLIELRGDDRLTLGAALAEAAGDDTPSTKPLRAPLLIAVVVSYRPSFKVPHWEQEAVASGVAHMLSLLLDEAGWGVIWRTGILTRNEAVARAHALQEDEHLLGWLYVGGKPDRKISAPRPIDGTQFLSRMPQPSASRDDEASGAPTHETQTGKAKKAGKKNDKFGKAARKELKRAKKN